mmetsp:Transcript_4704/g.6739  ORF Transcript_4704/g.6739 Transcript_4704/m.6739 type:complete len:608 (+) Transcript_4704:155-1978(+)
MTAPATEAAAERKKKRLEAWRKRQQQQKAEIEAGDKKEIRKNESGGAAKPQPKMKISGFKLSFSGGGNKAPKKKKVLALGGVTTTKNKNIEDNKAQGTTITRKKKKNPFLDDDYEDNDKGKPKQRAMGFHLDDDDGDEDNDDNDDNNMGAVKKPRLSEQKVTNDESKENASAATSGAGRKKQKLSRWDVSAVNTITAANAAEERKGSNSPSTPTGDIDDALDVFMKKLDEGALGSVCTTEEQQQQQQQPVRENQSVSPSKMLRVSSDANNTAGKEKKGGGVALSIDVSGSMMRPSDSAKQKKLIATSASESKEEAGVGGASCSSVLFTDTDWESDANVGTSGGGGGAESANEDDDNEETSDEIQTASQVRSEKQRREDQIKALENETTLARKSATAATSIGRLFSDYEGGVMEESERALNQLTAAPDALQVLAELNKKKELKAVDHSQVSYSPIKKNLYLVPRSLAKLKEEDVVDRRAKLKVRVRGVGCPAPVTTFAECGLSERILGVLRKQKISRPFPIQAQCLPAIMAGRDVIGIAKTGSGKTLAYLLPMLRHILAQDDLLLGESGPIGLILAPARELATQIHSVCRVFAKQLGLNQKVSYWFCV